MPAEGVNGTLPLHQGKQYHNTANNGRANEQPWHRMAAFMLLNGRTNSEIALAADVAVNSVSVLRAQRWFQELLATLENEAGQAYTALVQSEAVASLQKVVEIRDSENVNARTQLAAAQWIAEQANGKAVQKIESRVQHSHASPADELANIQAELQNLRAVRPVDSSYGEAIVPSIVQPTLEH